MKPAKVFAEALHGQSTGPLGGRKHITSMTFDDTGEFCTTTGEDEYFTTWNCLTGKCELLVQALYSGVSLKPTGNRKHKATASLKYGADNVTATHHVGSVLHTSTKKDHGIRQHSAHANAYLRYFMGHEAR